MDLKRQQLEAAINALRSGVEATTQGDMDQARQSLTSALNILRDAHMQLEGEGVRMQIDPEDYQG